MHETSRAAVKVDTFIFKKARSERQLKNLLLLAGLLALCLLPLLLNNYLQFVVNTMLVYCLVAVGFNVIIGYLGQLAFASAGFFGAGAYATGLAMAHWGLPFPAAVVVGGLAGGIVGWLVGLPALRVRGHYLSIITLAVGEILRWVYVHADTVTFGAGGFTLPDVRAFGNVLSDKGKYYFFLSVAVAAIASTSLLLRSRFGRAFVAVRNNERAAQSLGIKVKRVKIIAFAWSGLVVGLGGALFAALNGRVSPESFGLAQVLLHFAIVMIGGLGSLLGSILGAVLLTGAPELLRNFPGLEEIVFSLMLVLVLFFMPKGLGGLAARYFPLTRERLFRKEDDA
jgi:branched-chain amino acid transport system permease protein